jgi:hypothetical protein
MDRHGVAARKPEAPHRPRTPTDPASSCHRHLPALTSDYRVLHLIPREPIVTGLRPTGTDEIERAQRSESKGLILTIPPS